MMRGSVSRSAIPYDPYALWSFRTSSRGFARPDSAHTQRAEIQRAFAALSGLVGPNYGLCDSRLINQSKYHSRQALAESESLAFCVDKGEVLEDVVACPGEDGF
jgi:hypothetical protein